MPFRPLRSLSAVAVTSLLVLGMAHSAHADGDKDKDAMKLHDAAINEDYLNADFPKATGKLKDALKKCGSNGCSAGVLGKLHMSLGTIYGAGMSKLDQAKEEFVLALKADPNAALDASLSNPDLDKTFAEAKKSVGGGTGGAGGAGGATGTGGSGGTGGKKPTPANPPADTSYTAPAESAVNTPLAIYVEPSDEVALSKVTLRYKPFGAKQYKSVDLKKTGKGWGGLIPCEELTTTGDLKFFFAYTDDNGEAAGTLGSTKDPYKTTVKSEIEGDAPSLPGQKPPEQCKEKPICPPGMPGCEDTSGGGGSGGSTSAPRGDLGWGAACKETQQCQAGLGCKEGTCQEGAGDDSGGGGDGDKKKKSKRNLVGLGVQIDGLIVGSKDNVCSPPGPDETASYACFRTDASNTQFDGVIADKGGTNGIQGGLGIAGVRLLLDYDRQLLASIPLTLGARIGFAFGGSPSPDNTVTHTQQAKGFLPFHGEARIGYHFLGSLMEDKKFRPYVFVGGGLAQVNASVPVEVCDRLDKNAGKNACKTKSPSAPVNVDAYQITGLNFIGLGAGTTFGITPTFGVSAELKIMFMVPTFGVVIAPTLGPVVAF